MLEFLGKTFENETNLPGFVRFHLKFIEINIWICGNKDWEETLWTKKPGIEEITTILHSPQLRLYGHVQWAASRHLYQIYHKFSITGTRR